jgi:hypothetical protein
MVDAPEPASNGEASSAAQRWATRQEEIRAAAVADRKRAQDARAEQQQHLRQDYHSPGAFILGILVMAFLVIGGWFLINRMRCDPLFANPAPLRFHTSCE